MIFQACRRRIVPQRIFCVFQNTLLFLRQVSAGPLIECLHHCRAVDSTFANAIFPPNAAANAQSPRRCLSEHILFQIHSSLF
jgi:hypothetical protein